MKSQDIYQALRSRFSDMKYVLENSYIFTWESDFFFKTDSGYYVEVEVKVSRSDFKADFKKEKHTLFDKKLRGITKYVVPSHSEYWVTYSDFETVKDAEGRRVVDEKGRYVKVVSEKKRVRKHGGLPPETNDWEFIHSVEENNCHLYIKDVGNLMPHKFYFACPRGLIQPEEVPSYAGLLWIEDNGQGTQVKNCKFIHKEKIDITQTLLDKFYWLATNLKARLNNESKTILRTIRDEVKGH